MKQQKATKVTKTPDEEIWEKAWAEHEAVGKILQALKNVSQAERRRIMNYMVDRYVTNPEP